MIKMIHVKLDIDEKYWKICIILTFITNWTAYMSHILNIFAKLSCEKLNNENVSPEELVKRTIFIDQSSKYYCWMYATLITIVI